MTGLRRAIVVGGGFYGCIIALHLASRGITVDLFEREDALLSRASYANQARIHGGYHYPRSYNTAHRSQLNYQRFIEDWRPAVHIVEQAYYAIARQNSHITAAQFLRFCGKIGAPAAEAPKHIRRLFHGDRIEAVFSVSESVFDAVKLRELLQERLAGSSVAVHAGTTVTAVKQGTDMPVAVSTSDGMSLECDILFNCTYCDLYHLSGCAPPASPLKYELAELALVDPPDVLRDVGVTLMDGPFFSLMPFPSAQLSTLSHVRYTPHGAWTGNDAGPQGLRIDQDQLQQYSRGILMIRDAARYLPCIADAQYKRSLFEVKTVMSRHEIDDGRPILFQHAPGQDRIVFVLGSKIDNIYDALHAVDRWLND